MANIQDQIRSKVDAFTAEISALIQAAALDAVQEALAAGPIRASAARSAGRSAPAKAPGRAKRGAKKAAPAVKKAAKAPAAKGGAKKSARSKRPVGAKRPPAELAALVEKLGTYISKNPGQGVEVIGKALATPTSDLTLPLKKLLAAKRIRTEGQKRATKYFPA
jgi:hypothetical protein